MAIYYNLAANQNKLACHNIKLNFIKYITKNMLVQSQKKQIDLLIQADCLTNQKAGIFNYTKEITNNLIQNQNLNLKLIKLSHQDNHSIILPKKNYKLYGTYRFYNLLPKLINNLNPKMYWQPIHLLPPYINNNIKKIITIHDLSSIKYPEFHNFTNKFNHKLLLNYSLNKADKILTVSNTIKEELIDYNPKLKNKITTIYNGINLDPKFKKPEFNLPPKYFLYTGTIEPRKNLQTLIKAFNLIKDKVTEHLVLIGDHGWKSQEIHNKIQQHSKIHYYGFVAESNKNYIIKNASTLIYPSLYEGFGLPILEALNLQTPTITSDISTFKELFSNCSLFFDPKSSDQLAEIMLKISQNKLDPSQKVKNGQKKCQDLTWHKTSIQIENFFKEILSD